MAQSRQEDMSMIAILREFLEDSRKEGRGFIQENSTTTVGSGKQISTVYTGRAEGDRKNV